VIKGMEKMVFTTALTALSRGHLSSLRGEAGMDGEASQMGVEIQEKQSNLLVYPIVHLKTHSHAQNAEGLGFKICAFPYTDPILFLTADLKC
jgi:hypothetical protein